MRGGSRRSRWRAHTRSWGRDAEGRGGPRFWGGRELPPERGRGRDGAEGRFILTIPGKIHREFRGRLEVRGHEGGLAAIVEMDRETAVASIIAAESPGSPREAQKAQAVLARSFLAAAHGRHAGFDFCDTTHCQYLRDAPSAGTVAARAQRDTRGLVLSYEGRVIAALYSGNCGGHTRTLVDA